MLHGLKERHGLWRWNIGNNKGTSFVHPAHPPMELGSSRVHTILVFTIGWRANYPVIFWVAGSRFR